MVCNSKRDRKTCCAILLKFERNRICLEYLYEMKSNKFKQNVVQFFEILNNICEKNDDNHFPFTIRLLPIISLYVSIVLHV